jgi:hypothetical protein
VSLQVRARPISDYQRPFQIRGRLGSVMLHTASPVVAQEVETQTVFIHLQKVEEPEPEPGPLLLVHIAFENRILDPLPIVEATGSDLPQPAATGVSGGGYIVGDENEHRLQRQRKGGYPSSSPRNAFASNRVWMNGSAPTLTFSPRKG